MEAAKYRLFDETDTSNTTSVQFYDKKSYLNPCLDSSQAFVDKVITEIQKLHTEAGVPLKVWHFGGDEAKNIRLGGGYVDKNDPDAKPWQGKIDKSVEDKPWAKSQACQAFVKDGKVGDLNELPSYFAKEVSKIVAKHNIDTMQTWQDGLKGKDGFVNASEFAVKNVNVNMWETVFWGASDVVAELEDKGYRVVLSNPDFVYMDFPHEVNPEESGYYWGTRYTDDKRLFSFTPENLPQNAELSKGRDGENYEAASTKSHKVVYGMSMQLWSEIVRTDEQVQYMFFPRVVAGAERAWHKGSFELDYKVGATFKNGETKFTNQDNLMKEWNVYANVMGQRQLPKMDKAGLLYRIPVPGAKIVDGKLNANTLLPGLAIEYSLDGNSWHQYDAMNKPAASVGTFVRTVTTNGRHSRTTTAE
jgi:hexosaminidase